MRKISNKRREACDSHIKRLIRTFSLSDLNPYQRRDICLNYESKLMRPNHINTSKVSKNLFSYIRPSCVSIL